MSSPLRNSKPWWRRRVRRSDDVIAFRRPRRLRVPRVHILGSPRSLVRMPVKRPRVGMIALCGARCATWTARLRDHVAQSQESREAPSLRRLTRIVRSPPTGTLLPRLPTMTRAMEAHLCLHPHPRHPVRQVRRPLTARGRRPVAVAVRDARAGATAALRDQSNKATRRRSFDRATAAFGVCSTIVPTSCSFGAQRTRPLWFGRPER